MLQTVGNIEKKNTIFVHHEPEKQYQINSDCSKNPGRNGYFRINSICICG